jgi:uncharacterized protein YerC
MSQVSKYPIREEVFKRIFELLLKAVGEVKDRKETEMLIDDLLTPTEKIMLAKRLAIAVLLAKGYTYKAIREILRVSPPTIALVQIAFKYKGAGYRHFTQKVLQEEESRLFWEKVEDLVLTAASSVKGGSAWRYLRQEINQKRQKMNLSRP